ncbi:MAG: T9SS type A sorting domain-containing protein [Ignavibacterium sp.]|nr:MAG: T9SS type A sorting domain-containing protein [Ignavibacterium sp.]
MKVATFMFVHFFFCVIILSVITQAQNSYENSTGYLKVTHSDNGYIERVRYRGNEDAIYSGGLLFGQNGEGYGNEFHFFTDYFNVIPMDGFFVQDDPFTQYAYYSVALIQNPNSRTDVKVCSRSGHHFVFFRCTISNDSMNLDNVYPGIFADWDIGMVDGFAFNRGEYDLSRNLFYMYENGGVNDANYYGIMGIAINDIPMAPNTVRGTISGDIAFERPTLFDLMTSTTFSNITTNGDYKMFMSFGPFSIITGSQLVIDLAIVAGTSLTDLLANADDAIEYGPFVPVELTSFTATSKSGKVYLNWITASELNNLGFEIERKQDNNNWIRIGFVEGHGTTTELQNYKFIDDISSISANSLAYRLKQIDYNGTFEYSDGVFVDNPAPVNYALQQNYPNPFNPITTISYSLPVKSQVSLVVYNTLGENIKDLVNVVQEAGSHSCEFDATSLPNGIYFYRIQAGDYIETKKMVMMK